MAVHDGDPPTDAATNLGKGQWDLAFQATPADHRASRELPQFGFWAIIGMMCQQFGLPLLPSVVILACFGMTTAALTLVIVFVILSVVAAQTANNQALVDGVTQLRIREAHLEIETEAARSRLHWSIVDEVRLLRSWIYCLKDSEVAVLAPRRILSDEDAESMVLEMRQRIENASTEEPLAPMAEYEPFDYSELFELTPDERESLLQNVHQVAAQATLVDEDTHDVSVTPRQGCLTFSLLLMLGSATLIAAAPGANSQKILQWCAACAAIWLPQLIWRWREKFQIARQLHALDSQAPLPCKHGINAQGICSWTAQSHQFCPWRHILFIADMHQMLVFRASNGSLFATPHRALPAPEQTLQQAEHYWRTARRPDEDTPASDTEPDGQPQGPATESGNPYQPPA